MLSKLFLVLLGLTLAVGSLCTNGVSDVVTCNCFSSFYGEDCGSQALGACPLPTPQKLVTESVAELMSGDISANYFSFMVTSPMALERVMDEVSINGQSPCTFGGTNGGVINRVMPDDTTCVDRFLANLTIAKLVQDCQFTEDTASVPNFNVLSGSVSVSVIDSLGFIGGQEVSRTTTSSMNIELRLPTSVTVTSDILTLTSPITLEAAITAQIIENGVLILEFVTSVQYPYQLTSIVVPGFTSVSTTTCADDGLPCSQTHVISMTMQSCQLIDASFAASFPFSCRGAACGLAGTETADITFTVNTEDTCAIMTVVSSISGSLESFGDVAFSTPSISFIAGNRIYLLATISADVALESISLRTLSITPSGGSAVEVFNAASPTAFESKADFQTTSTVPTFGVSFLATFGPEVDDIFSSAGPNVRQFTVEATFDVVYKTTFRKRDTLTEALSIKKNLVLDATAL